MKNPGKIKRQFVRKPEAFRRKRAAIRKVSEKQVNLKKALRESEEKYRALFETMVQGVAYHAADGTIISANPPAKRILGLSLKQIQGRTSVNPRRKAIHEDGSDFPEKTHPSMMALKTGKKVPDVVMGIFNSIKKNYVWINVTAVPQFKAGERSPYQVYTTFEDITFRKETEEALRVSERRFRELFNHTSSGVAVYAALADGEDFLIVDLNHAGEKMEKVRKKEIIGKKVTEVFPGIREFGLLGVFQRVWRTGKTERHPVSLYKDNRIMGWKENVVYRLPSNEIVAVYEDITERKRAEEEIRALSLTDDLTGLYNRRAFFVLAKQQLRITSRARKKMFLFYADVDDLKRINDTLGHQEGDAALIDAAAVFKKTFRESDIIARIGGDEFVVLITETAVESKEVLVKRFQENLKARNLQENRKYRLNLSVGVVLCDPRHPRLLDDLFAQADKLMYDQKEEGRKKL
jgi:diguanylate cyclase (GGDEF)-like protein/PAS domain S-box-containing protein